MSNYRLGTRVTLILLALTSLLPTFLFAEQTVSELTRSEPPARVEATVNAAGYVLMRAELPEQAAEVFELNTRVFPEAFNTWDSLGEAHMELGHDEEAIGYYERSLELNPDNSNAEAMIERIRAGGG